MSQGVYLLDQALDLARQEMAALDDGSYELAVELAEQRGEITSLAWNMLATDEVTDYRSRLVALTEFQEHLTRKASRAQEAVRMTLNRSRQEQHRMRGYHVAVGQAIQ